jgi:hypothetical protein
MPNRPDESSLMRSVFEDLNARAVEPPALPTVVIRLAVSITKLEFTPSVKVASVPAEPLLTVSPSAVTVPVTSTPVLLVASF